VSGLSELAVDLLREDLPQVRVEPASSPAFRAVLNADRAQGALVADAEGLQNQGYELDVSPDGIEVLAGDAAGLWYGLQAFVQLHRAGPGRLPAARVRDWPCVQRRGIHLDLKGYQPRFERLLESFRMLSQYRINTVLLEVEDKFAYVGAPEVGIPSAYTAQQFRQLSELGRALSIEVIPKLQCLGHVDYLLRHERYRHLRENDHPYQYCPRNEDGMRLWEGMAGELMDCFDGHGYFHIGADEAGNLGECPVCREYSKAECYVHRVQQCVDAVEAGGRQAIMWEDILRNLHGNLADEELERTWSLGQKAILMYWAYGYGGKDNTFPLLSRYLSEGMKVWGASGYSGCGPSWIQNVPPLAERALNISAWTKTAIEHGLEGVMTTGWTRIASADPPAEPPEASWFPVLCAAESMWCGKERGLEEFCGAASRALFGADTALSSFLLSMRAADLPPSESPIEVAHQQERLDLVRAAAEVTAHDDLRRELCDTLHMYHGRVGVRLPDYRQRLVSDRVGRFRSSLDGRRHALQEALAVFYEETTVADVIASRFGEDEELVARAEEQLGRTEPV